MECEQLSMFHDGDKESIEISDDTKQNMDISKASEETTRVSENTLNAFSIKPIYFFGNDYDTVYPQIAEILPKEKTIYTSFPIEIAIRCEIVCAGICHQMNWDFLRDLVYSKTLENPNWLSAQYLNNISPDEVAEMFMLYSKPERIRPKERAALLRCIGEWLGNYENSSSIFITNDGHVHNKEIIRNSILSCRVFSGDPEEKKLQLLLQKLSMYDQLKDISDFCEPAIDYHLMRCYLRRGLLCATSKKGDDYIFNQSTERKESTVAAIRQLCSELLINICEYCHLDIVTVNQIEWHIGRSVCIKDNPDCYLCNKDAEWLKPLFSECPFIHTCWARCQDKDLLKVNEPFYLGSSY